MIGKPYSTPDPPPLPYLWTQDVHICRGKFHRSIVCETSCTGSEGILVPFHLCYHLWSTFRNAQDLTDETFLLAFQKFVGRRSLPMNMISDNGSTYMSAAEELHSLMEKTEVKEELGRRGVTWQFIPKRAPWFGGGCQRGWLGSQRLPLRRSSEDVMYLSKP